MPRFKWTVFAWAAWLVFSSILPALAAEDETPPAVEISANGYVVDPDGNPLAGARVVLREWSSARYSEDVYSDLNDIVAETKSGADGGFRFDKVPAVPFKRHEQYDAPWDVVAVAKGYGPAWQHLPKRASSEALKLTLRRPRRIEGRLVDSSGRAVADCRLTVVGIVEPTLNLRHDYEDPKRLDLWRSEIGPVVMTDADGKFELDDLPEDLMVLLSAKHPEFERSIIAVEPAAKFLPVGFASSGRKNQGPKPPPSYPSGFEHSLKPGGRLRGRVVYEDSGNPVADAKVSLVWENFGEFTTTDGNGQFDFDSVRMSPYNLSSLPEDRNYLGERLRIEFSPQNDRHDVVLKYARGNPVRGRVVDVDTNAGIAGVRIAYAPAENDQDSNWSPARSIETSVNGEFEFVVPSGAGRLRVGGGVEGHPTHDVPNYWRWRNSDHVADVHSAAIEVVAGEQHDEVVLRVTRGLVVRGRVVDGDGKPIALARVEAENRLSRSEKKQTHTDESGRFELAGYPPHEELQLKVSDSVDRLRASAEVPADSAAGAARVVDLGEIKLRGTARIQGAVIADGKPLPGASVHLSVFGKRDGEFLTSRQDAVVRTDENGEYSIDDVTTGEDFSLYVAARGYTNKGTKTYRLDVGQSLEIPPVEIKRLAASVGGVVVDLDGNPVANVTIVPWERDGYTSVPYGPNGPPSPTDVEGRFVLTDLPNVPLKLMAYVMPPADSKERFTRFPATVFVEPGQMNVRIKLDPKLQRPLP